MLMFTFCNLSLTSSSTARLSWQAVHTILFIICLCGTAPILKTLTETISTDTIWTMTVSARRTEGLRVGGCFCVWKQVETVVDVSLG